MVSSSVHSGHWNMDWTCPGSYLFPRPSSSSVRRNNARIYSLQIQCGAWVRMRPISSPSDFGLPIYYRSLSPSVCSVPLGPFVIFLILAYGGSFLRLSIFSTLNMQIIGAEKKLRRNKSCFCSGHKFKDEFDKISLAGQYWSTPWKNLEK